MVPCSIMHSMLCKKLFFYVSLSFSRFYISILRAIFNVFEFKFLISFYYRVSCTSFASFFTIFTKQSRLFSMTLRALALVFSTFKIDTARL